MSSSKLTPWRCLQICCAIDTESDTGIAVAGLSSELSLLQGSDEEVQCLNQPSGQALASHLNSTQPTCVYIFSQFPTSESEQLSCLQDVEWLEGFAASIANDDSKGHVVKLMYIDAVLPDTTVDKLAQAGVQHIVYWSAEQPGPQLIAAHFGHVFAAALRIPSTTVPEAFAIAAHACHVHLGTQLGQAEGQQAAALPCFRSVQLPTLPMNNSVPLPHVEGVDLSPGMAAAVPDWDDVRLLAPHAELRLLACGQASLIQQHRLSYLGQTLRALLVLEVRQLTVLSQKATQRIPTHLPSGCTAVCCQIQTASKAQGEVVLGGPHAVLQQPALVEHALRQTLAADALSLQFKLPPPGVPQLPVHTSPDLAGGTAVVCAVAVTSVWVVQVLRSLCTDSSNRMLASMGIAAVGCTTSTAFTQADAHRFTALGQLTSAVPESLDPALPPPSRPTPLGPLSHNTLSVQQQPMADPFLSDRQHSGSVSVPARSPAPRGRPAKEPKLSAPEGTSISWSSDRPELSKCSPKQLLEDMRQFLQVRRGKQLQASTFPEAILNGAQLDLNALYRAVCSRGGFATGIGVNWAGQVFPKMANHTNTHRMTGVGNALKRHYQALCLDYELAHPYDLAKQEPSLSG